MENLEKIVLGSGLLYVVEFTPGAIPADNVIETEANQLGYISGGATLEYKPTFVTPKDDLGRVSRTVLTEEDATLKSGVMTWNGQTLAKVCATARVTDANGLRTVKIGGISQADGKKYLIRFVHEDAVNGDIRITVVGSNQNGFTLAYVKDKETIVDAEFKAMPHDSDGTLVIYAEEVVTLIPLAVTSIAGSTTGKTAIAVDQDLTPGNSYVYKTGSGSATIPAFEAECAAGYTAWTYTTEITATTGHYILIVEIDSANKAIKAGATTVVSKA